MRLLFLAVLLVAMPALADDTLSISVLDKQGRGVPGVLVLLDIPAQPVEESTTYVVDQIDKAFVPDVLVVPIGAQVEFPNSDPVAHHVYSFSRPNSFVLPLYKGKAPQPVAFEHPGVVVLGCNIHDPMVGYIVVKEQQAHGYTDADGVVVLGPVDVSIGPKVNIWSPRIRTRGETLVKPVEQDGSLEFRLKRRLLADRRGTAKLPQY